MIVPQIYQHNPTKPIILSPQQVRQQSSQHVIQQSSQPKLPVQPTQSCQQSQNARKAIENYSFGLNDLIGKGFSSKVYKGRNDLTGQQLAIKVIEMQLLKTPLHHALLRSEIESLKTLESENVIKLHKVLQTQNNTYIITDFCDGGDLGSNLNKENHLLESAVAEIMIGIVNGYKALKQKGIIHRDLKPANILMKNGVPKIADFGFATTPRSRTTMPNVNVGSPLYMSPSALRQNQYSEKSDIWALGVSVFELLYGQVPWQASSEKELAQKMLTVPCHFPTSNGVVISEECKAFIRYCLTVDEEKKIIIEDLEKHPWLKRRWVQSKAQESAKKALNAPMVQVKQMSHCKPIRNSPLGTKNTNAGINTQMFEGSGQDGKENTSTTVEQQHKKPSQYQFNTNSFLNQNNTNSIVTSFMQVKNRQASKNKMSQDYQNSTNVERESVNEETQKSFQAEYVTDIEGYGQKNSTKKSGNTTNNSQVEYSQQDPFNLIELNNYQPLQPVVIGYSMIK